MKRSLFTELKRRNVIRMAGLYLVAAWLVVQVFATLLPVFEAPSWVMKAIVAAVAIGFLPAVVFAWVYEITPEGIKRESEVEPDESMTPRTGRRMDRAIIVVLALAFVAFAVDRFVLAPRREAAHDVALRTEVASGNPKQQKDESATSIPDIENDPSIAVLPMVNMSEDKGNEYFSDGVAEELLDLLAKVPNLRVIARTSSFSFKGKDTSIKEIAQVLKVAAVLEGSVRKSGDKVRITVQLIRAKDSSHLWSKTYERTLDDIFKVQDEIAAAVVDQLKLKLLGAVPTIKSVDPRAYPLILQARSLADQSSIESTQKAIDLYQQAVAIAPAEPRAWDGLARVYSGQASMGARPAEEGFRLAREAANKALAIEPNDTLAHAYLGRVASEYDGDLAVAAAHFQKVLALQPTDGDALRMVGYFLNGLGRQNEAIVIFEHLATVDPANPTAYFSLGYTYCLARRWDKAIDSLHRALTLSPKQVGVRYMLSLALLGKGNAVEALAAMQSESSEAWRAAGLPLVYQALGRTAEFDAALADLVKRHAHDQPYAVASAYASHGDSARAFEWLERTVAMEDPSLQLIVVDASFAKLHDDPRWLPFLRKIGKAPEQLAKIQFNVTLPKDWQPEATADTAEKPAAAAH